MNLFNFRINKPKVDYRALPMEQDDFGMGSSDMLIKDDDKQREIKGGELTISGVYAACEAIAGSISVMPITVKCYNKDKEEDTGWVEDVFYNGLMTAPRLMKQMIMDLLLYGNGYAYIRRNKKGRATELQYLQSKDVVVEFYKETNTLIYRCSYINGGKPINYMDMIHLVKNTRDGYTGISVITLAEKAINITNKTEKVVADYFSSGLNVSGILHAKASLTKPQALQAMKSFEKAHDVGKGKFVRFLPYDCEFEKLTESAKEATLIDNRRYNLSEIARYFGINPQLLQDLSDAKYTSVESTNLQFLTNTLLQYVIIIEAEFNKKIVPAKSSIRINLDEASLLRTDAKSTADYFSTLTKAGILTINEARESLGYIPVQNADRLIVPFSDIAQNTIADLDDPNFKPMLKTDQNQQQNVEEKPESESESTENSEKNNEDK